MKRNLQVVGNKVSVVVVIVVVILVVLVTVISSVRVIGLENISMGVATENIIVAAPETSGVLEIAGVVVVNPNGVGRPMHVQPDVVPAVWSNIGLGRIHGSRYLGEAYIDNNIAQRAESSDSIAIATIEQIAIADIRAGISSINAADAGSIASIDAYIGGHEAESIAQIDAGVTQNIGDGKITDIAAASIIDRSSSIERIS